LICTFPSRKYDIEDFPAIKSHLLTFGYERLEQSGKTYVINGEKINARKKTNNKWFETQDSISYWDDFYKQKIVYNDINQRLSFALVEPGIFFNNTVYFISENSHMNYLLSCLNSKVINWFYKTLSVQLGEKAVRMFSIYMKNIPIPIPTLSLEKKIGELVDLRICKENDHSFLENEIDKNMYQLFTLTPEEIDFIEKQ
jgi:adenine-specific DNA-methyltransferase